MDRQALNRRTNQIHRYTKRELARMFEIKNNCLAALDLILKDLTKYRRGRHAAVEMGLIGC
jgi:hypothetical protein